MDKPKMLQPGGWLNKEWTPKKGMRYVTDFTAVRYERPRLWFLWKLFWNQDVESRLGDFARSLASAGWPVSVIPSSLGNDPLRTSNVRVYHVSPDDLPDPPRGVMVTRNTLE